MKRKIILLLTLVAITSLYADRDEHYKKEKSKVVNKELKALYINECSACHIAYQAEFLPKKSWQKIMTNLEEHFGTDASLDKEDRDKILKYLTSNASDSKRVYGEFREFLESISKDKTPIKITEIPYFKKEHRKIPKKYIHQKDVKSLSNCTACHKKAESGSFGEREIYIPNYGRWDD